MNDTTRHTYRKRWPVALATVLTILALMVPALVIAPSAADAQTPTCASASSDPDGDGWGFANGQSCRVDPGSTSGNSGGDSNTGGNSGTPTCASASSDPDGDGFGFENGQSCRVDPGSTSGNSGGDSNTGGTTGNDMPTCTSSSSDPDGDGFGFENGETCRVNECPDSTVAIAGDSWAFYTADSADNTTFGSDLRVIGGTSMSEIGLTARQMVPGTVANNRVRNQLALQQAFNPNCERTLVLSIGGNDYIAAGRGIPGFGTTQINDDIRAIIRDFLELDPALRIVIPGYDLVNTSRTATCRALAAVNAGGVVPDFAAVNTISNISRGLYDSIAADFERVDFADLAGSVQGRPGNPDYTASALPNSLYTRLDCIHLSIAGHGIFNHFLAQFIDPSIDRPVPRIFSNSTDFVYVEPPSDYLTPGQVLEPNLAAPYRGTSYNSMVIDYEQMHVNRQHDSTFCCDDEIVLAVIEFQTTPGVPGSTSARYVDRGLTRLEGDQGRTRTIPDSEGRFVITDMNPPTYDELRRNPVIPTVRGQMIVALEAEPAWLAGRSQVEDRLEDLADELVDRLAPLLETPDLATVSGAGTAFLETDLIERLIQAGLDAERSISDGNFIQEFLADRVAIVAGYGLLLFVETPAGADQIFNPVFHENFSEPVIGGAAGNAEFIVPIRDTFGSTRSDPWYEIRVQVQIGNNLS